MTTKLAALVFTLLVALPLAAQGHKAYTDEQIQTMIEHELSQKHIEGVKVDVSSGIVTLEGTITSVWAKDEASKIAQSIHDVKDVRVELTITPAVGGDDELAALIRAKVLRNVYYTIFDEIGFAVKDGAVTLFGRVTAPYKAQDIATLASKEPGVQKVDNQIEVLPLSPADDQLRSQLATQIYQEFPDYATQSNPPIHIIVENGHVTLFGVVRNQVERRQILNIVRSTFGVMGVEDKLIVEAT